jgi:uncharacterized protein (DUF58 family)
MPGPRLLWARLRLWGFRQVYRLSRLTRRRFTPAGRVALSTTLAAGALGIDTRVSFASALFSLGAALFLLSTLALPLYRERFRVTRMLPRYATEGVPLRYRLAVENPGRRAHRDLVVADELAGGWPGAEAFSRWHPPGEGRINWFDRQVGFPRFVWLTRRQQGAAIPEAPVPPLAAAGRTEVELEALPLRRGRLRFSRTLVARPDPLGLLRGLVAAGAADEILVLPRRHPVPTLDLPGRRREQPGGVAFAGHVGESEEFVSVRDYRSGDPLRHIHWRGWARTGRPVVKEYRDEYFVRHALVLDTFCPAFDPRFEAAVSAAASYACTVDTRESLLDLVFVGRRVHRVTAGRGVGGAEQLLEVLACVEPVPEGRIDELRRTLESHAGGLSGGVAVLVGWDAERARLLRDLRRRGLPLLALVVTGEPLPEEAAALGARRLRPEHLAQDLAALGEARHEP